MNTLSKIILLWLGWVVAMAVLLSDSYSGLVFLEGGPFLGFRQATFEVMKAFIGPALLGILCTYIACHFEQKRKNKESQYEKTR